MCHEGRAVSNGRFEEYSKSRQVLLRCSGSPWTSPDTKTHSNVEPEVHHVPVAHDVVFSLKPHLSRFARALLAPAGDVIVEGDDLGAYESALKVSVDHAR